MSTQCKALNNLRDNSIHGHCCLSGPVRISCTAVVTPSIRLQLSHWLHQVTKQIVCSTGVEISPVSCSLLSGYERLLSAKKVTIDNVAFHVPYLDYAIGPASLVRENEAGGSWGQEVYILHVNV